MSFTLIHQDKNSQARVGKLETLRGVLDTPVFMPVATQGTAKALTKRHLDECKTQAILVNAYHLYLRPGLEVIKNAGGLHKFMNWPNIILTDSGGYQVFSLSQLRKVTDKGVEFQSHIDGSKHFLAPEDVIDIQDVLGSDIFMPLDECVHYPCAEDHAASAVKRTIDWARRSKRQLQRIDDNRRKPVHRLLFGIVQGATYTDLRKCSIEELVDINFDGYALGGISVGEPQDLMYNIIQLTAEYLPKDSVRYLMGVGTPEDIISAVDFGIDMFDCVIPTRYGRSGTAFTSEGKLTVRNAPYINDLKPLDQDCSCFVCRNFSRSYIRHLFNADEISGLILVSCHNVYFYLELMQRIREAIRQGKFSKFKRDFLSNYNQTLNSKQYSNA